MVGAASRRTSAAGFHQQTLKKRTRAAPPRTAQRLFDRVGLKKQILAAAIPCQAPTKLRQNPRQTQR